MDLRRRDEAGKSGASDFVVTNRRKAFDSAQASPPSVPWRQIRPVQEYACSQAEKTETDSAYANGFDPHVWMILT
jgi:hypothetical protein